MLSSSKKTSIATTKLFIIQPSLINFHNGKIKLRVSPLQGMKNKRSRVLLVDSNSITNKITKTSI